MTAFIVIKSQWVKKSPIPVHVPQRNGEGHDRITDELQLVLENRVLGRETLLAGAVAGVALVVGGASAVRVAALEMVLPELYQQLCTSLDLLGLQLGKHQ